MFFETKDTIADGFGFKIFGATHLLWLVAFVLLCAVSIFVYRNLNTKNRNIMRIAIAVTVFVFETVKNCVAVAAGNFEVEHLSFHLCGISVVLISYSIFKRNETVEMFLYYIGIPGAMLALLTPDWTRLPCNNFFHINSFTMHILLVLYPLLLVTGGDLKPDLKSVPKCVALLLGFAVPALVINLIAGTNFMFLMRTDNIGFLTLFKNIFGAHQWAFPILLPIILSIMYLPIFIAEKIKAKLK